MHTRYLWRHYPMPLVFWIFLFFHQEQYSGDRWMSLCVQFVCSNISDPFLIEAEQHSYNKLVLCILEHCSISYWTFFSSLPYFFTGKQWYDLHASCVFRCRTLVCLMRAHLMLTMCLGRRESPGQVTASPSSQQQVLAAGVSHWQMRDSHYLPQQHLKPQ